MRIALAGPVHIDPLLPWLQLTTEERARLPQSLVGSPVTQLAAGLLERGHELVIASLHGQIAEPAVFSGPQLKLCLSPYRSRHRARDLFKVERALLQAALESAPVDIINAHWSYEYALAALATDRPTVVTVRDWAPTVLRLQPTPYRAVRLLMNRMVLRRGSHFTVASPYMKLRLQRRVARDIPVIPNGLADEAFSEGLRSPSANAPTLLAVNKGFVRRKNVTALLQAFPIVRAWNPRCSLQLVGQQYSPGDRPHSWATQRGLTDGVQFCGPMSHGHVLEMMRAADLFVHPALEESFGMVLVEAMAQGTPVIGGSDSGAVPWVLDEGRAGMLADVRSPDALAQAIIGALSDEDEWGRLSKAGFTHASETFRLSSVVDRYLAVYDDVLASSR